MLCPQIFIAKNSCIIATETQWTPSKCPKLHTKQSLSEKPPNRWKKLQGSIPTVLIPNLPDISADFSPPTPQCNIHHKKNSWAPTGLSEGGREGGEEEGEDKKEGNNRKIDAKPVQTWGRKKERDRALIRSRTKRKERNHTHTRSDQQKKGRGSSKGQRHKHTCRPLLTSSSSDEGGCCCTTGCWRAAVAGGSRW